LKTVVKDKGSGGEALSMDEAYLLTTSLDVTATFEKYIQDFVGFAAFDLQDNGPFRNYLVKAQS
jgi:hypothetical protein